MGPPGESAETAAVEWVIDGDTLDLIIDGRQERVRLIGVDTPETVSRETPVQCFGEEASAALKGLLPVNSAVRIERDIEARDRFGRLLLYVYRAEDDLFINEWLVANGYGDTLFFEPNTAFRSSFTEKRNMARSVPLGLWASCEGPDQPLE
jgi:micrococcal nuclease